MIRILLFAIAAASLLWPQRPSPAPAIRTRWGPSGCSRSMPRPRRGSGRKQFPSTLPLARQGAGADLRRRPVARAPLRRFWMRSRMNACARHSFCSAGMRRHIRNSPGERWPRATASAITPIRTPCSTACRSPRPKPRSTAASRRTNSRSTASGAATPTTPFFRFPGFASNPALLDRMSERGLVVFGADVWASDWVPMTPEQELRLILARIEQVGRGIVLFHDTKAQTAHMLPAFLRELKRRELQHRTRDSRPEPQCLPVKASLFCRTSVKTLGNKAVPRSHCVISH